MLSVGARAETTSGQNSVLGHENTKAVLACIQIFYPVRDYWYLVYWTPGRGVMFRVIRNCGLLAARQ